MKDINYNKVEMFIRVSRDEKEPRERAVLVARDEKGREFVFTYVDFNEEHQDLTVCNFITDSKI